MKGEGRIFTDTTEALLAYQHGVVDLQALIKVRLGDTDIYDVPLPRRLLCMQTGSWWRRP